MLKENVHETYLGLPGDQYLPAGYVFSNLMKKVKNHKNYSSVEIQNMLSMQVLQRLLVIKS